MWCSYDPMATPTLEVTRSGLLGLLQEDVHKSAQVAELQTRGTQLVEENRRLKAEYRELDDAHFAMRTELTDLKGHTAKLYDLLARVALAGDLDLKTLTKEVDAMGLELRIDLVADPVTKKPASKRKQR